MSEDLSISVELPLDTDGFLRRECPSCEREFKWLDDSGDDQGSEAADQYFCPLCGQASGADTWWTTAQLEHMNEVALASTELNELLEDGFRDALKGIKGISVGPSRSSGPDAEMPSPLIDPDDMVIVESPCHPQEPVKVPDDALQVVHCLVCGAAFTA